MKKQCLIAFAVVLSVPSLTYANDNVVVPVVAGSGSANGRMYVGGPGTYNQVEADVTGLAKEAIADAQLTQKEDKDYVIAAVKEIHDAYVAYANALIAQTMLDMEATGVKGLSVDVDTFLRATADLKLRKAAFDSLLVKNASINKETLPSNYEVSADVAGNKQKVPTTGMVQLDKVVAKYQQMIKTELDPQLKSYSHIKIEQDGVVITIADYKDLLAPDFSKFPVISPEKRTEITAKIIDLRDRARKIGTLEKHEFGTQMRNEYNSFFKRFGADFHYKYRSGGKKKTIVDDVFSGIFGSDKSDEEVGKGETVKVPGMKGKTDIDARNESFERLVDIFWMRSYLRLKHGVGICAMQPKFVEASNLNGFQAVEALRELRTDAACEKEPLEDALENARRILEASGVQSEHVFEGNWLDSGLINKLGSSVTFLKGDRASAEVLHMLVQLVYLDIQEELFLAQGDLNSAHELYVARYQGSDEMRAHYHDRKCAVDYEEDSCGDVGTFGENASAGTQDDVLASFIDLNTLNSNVKDILGQADRLELTLKDARKGEKRHEQTGKRATEL